MIWSKTDIFKCGSRKEKYLGSVTIIIGSPKGSQISEKYWGEVEKGKRVDVYLEVRKRRGAYMFLMKQVPVTCDHIFNIHSVQLSYSCLELRLDRIWWYSPGCMVGILMSVGVMTVGEMMTVGVLSVGEITVGVMTVGVMIVGVMRRPRLACLS